MRILLDACVPRGLRDRLSGHEVRTAHEMGWGDLNNGALLAAIAGRFDALVTVDKHLPRQQRIEGRPFGIVVLRARSNRLADLLPLIPGLLAALPSLRPGGVLEVSG
jgi:predicted nuclease of predicted toxin-antitoxin system